MTGSIVGADGFSGFMFAPESSNASVYCIGELSGVPILFIKLILGVLVLIFPQTEDQRSPVGYS